VRYGVLVSLTAAASLLFLYVSFVQVFIGEDLLSGATAIELGIFFLQFFKVVAMVFVRRLRDSRMVNLVDIFGAELVVLLIGLMISDLFLGFQAAPGLMVQILLAWIAGIATFATPFAIYRFARAMTRGEVLLAVLPSGVFLSEFMLLLAAGANAAAASGLGLAGLSRTMLLVGASLSASGAKIAGVTALPPLAIFYVSLLLYALAPPAAGEWRLRGMAALALLATVVTYGCVYVASWFTANLAYVILPPTLIAATLMWWTAREA